MRRCLKCGHRRAWRLADGRFKCQGCGVRFSWTSVWDSIRLEPRAKRQLLQLFSLGVPSYRQRFRSAVSAKARERFYRLARAVCAHVEQLREPFEGALECDETTFGGARHGKRGWGAAGKIIVFGIVKRNGEVKAMPIQAHSGAAVWQEIIEHTKPGSLYYTDDWQAYASLRTRGEHVVIRKERGRPKGRDTINGIEGFWSYAKNWLYPYRGVPTKYFHLYLGELCFRFNHRQRDMQREILHLMRSLSIQELTPTLVRKG